MTTLPLRITFLVAALWLPLSVYSAQNILVFGDSLSAGYGIAVAESWPSLLQRELERSHPGYRIVNASISGETTRGGKQRIAKALQQHQPEIVIVELGANDGLRGFRNTDTEANLKHIVEQAKNAGAKVLLVGMRLPPNYGSPYAEQFHDLFRRVAETQRVRLAPFLLDGITPEQYQPDNLHPTAAAQPLLMQNVLKELKPLLP